MNLMKVVILSGLAMVMMSTAQIVFAEEAAVEPADSVTITSNQQAASQKDGQMQWAWGEVTNLDNQARTVTLKYLDYETDQEKELVLVVDEKTAFENIQDFNELKLKDTLSIDYMIEVDNKNIAKNISFDKPDALSSVSAQGKENSEPITPPSSTGQTVVDAVQPAVPPETAALDLANEAPAAQEPAPAPAAPAESVPAAQGQVQ
ncbi:MAG: hypothetical protein NTX01_06160 [Candidatus Omnitrophica bacterium]|nr:hypothetical protein [Candidatus Omnitrophota bacterium]